MTPSFASSRTARAAALLAATSVALGACSLLTDLSPIAPRADASDDAPITAPDDGFTIVATPAHAVVDPGDALDVSISIARGKSFADLVDVTVNDVGGLSGFASSPATLTFTSGAPVTLHVDIAKDAKTPQDGVITLLGVARGNATKTSTTKLGLRLGSVILDTTTSTSFTVPSWASRVYVKAWGAGGGAGSSFNDGNGAVATGGNGGGGGFLSAWVDLAPGAKVDVAVGTPGTTAANCSSGSACRGGGGGGYTAVSIGPTVVGVAGGGGGGSGSSYRVGCTGADNATHGAAGGGGDGEVRKFGLQGALNISATTTAGGAAGGANATPGTALQGGSAPMNNNRYLDGGVPGGGNGGSSGGCGGAPGGGGGGGWFGGGGGANAQGFTVFNGGGGGAGYLDGGVDAARATGAGASAGAAGDADRKGAGGGGVADPMTPTPATAGRVVVRAAKP